jgi:predicted phage terminase large subunit-like protein
MTIIQILIRVFPSWFAFIASFGEWKPAKHLLLIERIVLKGLNSGNAKMIINLPPRHGKSEFISKYFPAFLLSNSPQKRIMLASYQASFASIWGAEVKQILESFSNELFGIAIAKSSKAKGNFKIAGKKGGMYSVGAGGSLTGRGADVMIIDDPIKNDKDAMSQKIRDNHFRWFQATAFTRLEPNGLIILMMTRWHEDDLAGRIIKDYAQPLISMDDLSAVNEKWLWINIPALAETNDILGRAEGSSLWERRFSMTKLEEIRNQIGDFWFSALYQQRPAPANGNIFRREHFKYFSSENDSYLLYANEGIKINILKDYLNIYATVDLASSISQRADYTVIMIFGLTSERDILILDIIREKFEASSHLKLIESIYQKWEPRSIGIEKVQYQISLIEAAKAKGYPVVSLIPDKDKLQRALPIVHQMKEGKVYFHKNAYWLNEFERELLNFPNSEHDDQVDAFAYIMQMIKPISNLKPVGVKRNSFFPVE